MLIYAYACPPAHYCRYFYMPTGMMNNSHRTPITPHAQLQWDGEGQPVSSLFGDIYFSNASGLAESRHVFLQHNQLAERWQNLQHYQHFTIAETGFGSGLNFLTAWDLWLKTAPESAQLHFVSVEKFPLNLDDLTRALALWPELESLSAQLIDAYPVFVGTGMHRLNFCSGRIKLTLVHDDATIGFNKLLVSSHPLFSQHSKKVDAWFLDGFSPTKNPQMWSDELFDVVAKLSHNATTAATFSASALVKNGLKRAGFCIQKVAGFGRKRDMVKALYHATPPISRPEDYTYRGSFSPYPIPWSVHFPQPLFHQRHAVIIGGGLAGCHSARALAERGWQVTLLERNRQLAQEASGNPQGVLYAKLSPLDEAQAAFNLASLQYAIHYYRHYWDAIGSNCGVLQLAHKPSELELHQLLKQRFAHASQLVEFVDAERASKIAGVKLEQSGLYFPQAGWINPQKLCAELTDHPNIHVIYQACVLALKQVDDDWQVSSDESVLAKAPVVIIANAQDALTFPEASHLPLKRIRGQITYLPAMANAPALNTVVCGEGYICPADSSSPASTNMFCIGATFNLNDSSTETRINDHQTNLDNLRKYASDIAHNWKEMDTSQLEGRVGFRCTLPDYLPAVGALPAIDDLLRDFAPLRKNAKAGITQTGSYLTGLYINIGHGARGLAYTPLCAELLAAQINNEVLPLPTELANALSPARFIIRDLIRNKR